MRFGKEFIMKSANLILVAGALVVGSMPVITPASAEMERKVIIKHDGGFDRGCRTMRVVKEGFGGHRVVTVKKVCR